LVDGCACLKPAFLCDETLLEAGGRQLARLKNINAQTGLDVLKDKIIIASKRVFGRDPDLED